MGRKQTKETRIKISKALGGSGILQEKRKTCLSCGKPITSPTFCDQSCQQDYRYKQFLVEWDQRRDDGVRANGGTTSYVKRWLIETYGNKCSICGWNEINPITGFVPVELDHINGDWSNNSKDNIRLLCPNCHSLTPFFRALNKGKGRKLGSIG